MGQVALAVGLACAIGVPDLLHALGLRWFPRGVIAFFPLLIAGMFLVFHFWKIERKGATPTVPPEEWGKG